LTTEIVFRCPDPKLFVYSSHIPEIEQEKNAKLLGVILSEVLHFDVHVLAVLKVCSHIMYLLELLAAQDLPPVQLNTAVSTVILNKVKYVVDINAPASCIVYSNIINYIVLLVVYCCFVRFRDFIAVHVFSTRKLSYRKDDH